MRLSRICPVSWVLLEEEGESHCSSSKVGRIAFPGATVRSGAPIRKYGPSRSACAFHAPWRYDHHSGLSFTSTWWTRRQNVATRVSSATGSETGK